MPANRIIRIWVYSAVLPMLLGIGCRQSTSSLQYSDLPAPVINSIEPDSGVYGTKVTITGDHFGISASEVSVKVNDAEAEVLSVSDQRVDFILPLAARSGFVRVTVFDQSSLGPLFRYIPTVRVTTKAGSSIEGYRDGEQSVARFNEPWGIETSENGQVFTSDFQNSMIRKLQRDDQVSTFASFPLDHPMGLALGVNGILYVADAFNNMIQTISLDGEITIYAGNGLTGNADGPRLEASFNLPADVAVRQSDLTVYVADALNHKIRVITPGGMVRTLAGQKEAGYFDGEGSIARFNTPGGLALSPDESTLYIADFRNHAIRALDLSTGEVSTLAGNGSAGYRDGTLDEALFNRPFGITVDRRGIIYVADSENHRIRMIEKGMVSTIAGTGTKGYHDGRGSVAQFHEPYHIVISRNGGRVMYVADRKNNVIRQLRIE